MLNIKSILISIIFLFLYNVVSCQEDEKTKIGWSGRYKIESYGKNKKDSLNIQYGIIEKTLNAKVEDIVRKYETDLVRWNMITQTGSQKDSVLLRRFLMNEEFNEYEEFGWTELYKSGKMKCLDGGHFFLCKTTVDNKVKIGEEEFIATTGIFGIVLHKGLFEFTKID
ncbi:phosphate ABC transporter permease [Maribacter sp. BPC-D8]|uniref:phosphate ABC transporter permease n=1 Tax=Maribacter sp. BPC-D8 TaxID=3053613 RepID=UPI002B4A730E|nr:phosphate ABC transporter permease [Maribacter sp. BPC-D8]WRI30275.1 phosphate ABC transporter permease [Maribacter sp. BPC-D8]